jgi:hypothetical protein
VGFPGSARGQGDEPASVRLPGEAQPIERRAVPVRPAGHVLELFSLVGFNWYQRRRQRTDTKPAKPDANLFEVRGSNLEYVIYVLLTFLAISPNWITLALIGFVALLWYRQFHALETWSPARRRRAGKLTHWLTLLCLGLLFFLVYLCFWRLPDWQRQLAGPP